MLLEQPAPAQSPVLHPTALHSSPPWLPHKAPEEQHSWSPRDLHQGFQFLAKELHARAREQPECTKCMSSDISAGARDGSGPKKLTRKRRRRCWRCTEVNTGLPFLLCGGRTAREGQSGAFRWLPSPGVPQQLGRVWDTMQNTSLGGK